MKPIKVRLMNEYTVDCPLWGPEGATDFEDWELSPQLTERLAAWAAFFNAHFHEDHGFPSVEMARKHRAEGIALQPLVAEELGPRYMVVGDFWETDDLEHPLQGLVDRFVRAVAGRGRQPR
ncbi:hypothetical protein [Brachybacterium sp. UNK5269]|uniref:hypothetical protein n=1 Tax=Brachybacterium sp. UNK5269 TaxID=3408576 RepID=UPI003BB13074